MDHPESHSRALEMNRKEVGWARRALGVGRGLGQTCVCPQGFHLAGGLVHTLGSSTNTWSRVHGAGEGLCSTDQSDGSAWAPAQALRGVQVVSVPKV